MQTDRVAPGSGTRRAEPPGLLAHGTDAAAQSPQPFRLAFSGSGSEYFRVWIVNLLLNVVTLGFYTPFARRRTAQYFYSHTLVADSPLEFTAQQRKMVFGFLLLVVLYMAFRLAADTGQDTAVSAFLLAAAALAPYLWASAMRFRLSATRWRGVRLQLTAGWGEVYRASWPMFAIALVWILFMLAFAMFPDDVPAPAKNSFLVRWRAQPQLAWPLLATALVLTLLCIIRLEFNYKSLLFSRAHIGTQAGRWKPAYRDFVRIWLAALAVLLAGMIVIAIVPAVLMGAWVVMLFKTKLHLGLWAIISYIVFGVLLVFSLFLATAPARAYRQARMFQLVWNNVGVSGIARFKCRLRARPYVLLRLKNMLLALVTLGFYRPFAMISEYRMKTESVTLHVKGGLNQLVGQLVRQQDGIGDALADAVGLDLVG